MSLNIYYLFPVLKQNLGSYRFEVVSDVETTMCTVILFSDSLVPILYVMCAFNLHF